MIFQDYLRLTIMVESIVTVIVIFIILKYRQKKINRSLAEQIIINICLWDIAFSISNILLSL